MIRQTEFGVATPESPVPSVPLSERLGQATIEERRRALRALLQRPLLTADGPYAMEFGLVRRHAEWLRRWLAQNAGWRLQVDAEVARLRKSPAELKDGTRPARDVKNGTPFSRRRYVLLCLALAALERSDRQTTLGRVAEDIVVLLRGDAAIAEAGIDFDLDSHDQRRDLVQVVRLLMELRVLVRVHGDEEQFLAQKGDSLYNINRPVLAAMLNVSQGPSTVEAGNLETRIAAIVEEPLPDTDEGRNRRLRSKLTRKLLDDPVLYYAELDADELAYLNSQRGHILREVEHATGLIPEIRSEGIALVDERTDMTDLGLPEEGTNGHLALLLAEYLAEQIRYDERDEVGYAELYEHVAELISEHRAHWRKDVAEPGAEVALTEQTLVLYEALRLVQRTEDGVRPLPAIARFAVDNEGNHTSRDEMRR